MILLTQTNAHIALEAASAEAELLGVSDGIAVVDATGVLIGFIQPGRRAVIARDTFVRQALHAAIASFENGTMSYELGVEIASARDQPGSLSGGLPIVCGGQVLGAIGVGCESHAHCIQIAEAGCAALIAHFHQEPA